MEPRLFSRGNHPPLWIDDLDDLLQWSRGFSAAEIIFLATSSDIFPVSFNGAAAFQPRK